MAKTVKPKILTPPSLILVLVLEFLDLTKK